MWTTDNIRSYAMGGMERQKTEQAIPQVSNVSSPYHKQYNEREKQIEEKQKFASL